MRVLLILFLSIASLFAALPEMEVTGNGSVITDGDATPAAGDDTDFGYAHVDTETPSVTYTINNTGGDTLDVSNITATGDFTVSTNPTPTTVASGGSATFTVTFDPTATGVRAGTISIDNNDSDENPYNFSIQGEGAYPEMGITGVADGDTVGFGTAHVSATTGDGTNTGNGTVTNTYTVNNTGNVALDLSAGVAVGTGTHFSATNPAASVAAGGSTTFTVTFNPTITGTVPNDTISLANDDQDENPYNFTVTGTGTYSEISVTGAGTNIADGGGAQDTTDDTYFGSENINTGSSARTYIIANNGASTDNLYISNITGSGDFSVTTDPSPTNVAAGGSTTFTVTFDPSALGDRTGTITIYSDDTNDIDDGDGGVDESTFTFSVLGVGDNNITNTVNLSKNSIDFEYAQTSPTTTTVTPLSTLPSGFPGGYTTSGDKSIHTSELSGAMEILKTGAAGVTFEAKFTFSNDNSRTKYKFLGALKYGSTVADANDHWYNFGRKSENDLNASKAGTGYVITDGGKGMIIYLEDGKWGDDDMAVNGTIDDPIFPLIGYRAPISKEAYLFLILSILAIGYLGIRREKS